MGRALKNLFLKPRLRGGVSQLLSLRLAAAELCNKMLFVGLRRRRRRRRNCKKTAEFALCHPSEIQSPGSNTAPIKKKKQKKKRKPSSFLTLIRLLILLSPLSLPSVPTLARALVRVHTQRCGGKAKKKKRLACLIVFYFGVQKRLRFPSWNREGLEERRRGGERLASGRPAAYGVTTTGLTGCIRAAGGGGGGVRPEEEEEEEEVSVVALRTTRLLNFLFLGDGRYLD